MMLIAGIQGTCIKSFVLRKKNVVGENFTGTVVRKICMVIQQRKL